MRSVWSRRLSAAGLVLGAAALLAAPAAAQDTDVFAEAATYFKAETVEGVSKHAESAAETPATVTVISRDEIERYGFRTVADVLNFASMGNTSVGDRRYDLVGSRGIFVFEDYNSRILVMLNGHAVNEPWSNFGDVGRAMLVPLDLVERIEIVYGPSALLYGGYSLYGIVNVITRPAATLAGTRVRVTGGSWGTGEAVASWARTGTYGGLDESAEWSVLAAAGAYRSSGEDLDLPELDVGTPVRLDGSTIYGGPQSGTDFERAPFAFVQARRGELSALARTGYRERGTPFAPYGALYGSGEQMQRDVKSLVELRWDHEVTRRLSVSTRAFHDIYRYVERDPYLGEDGGPPVQFRMEANARETGAEGRLHYARGTHFFTAGAEYRRRSLDRDSSTGVPGMPPLAGSVIRQDSRGHLAVVYAQEEWRPRGWLSLVAGGNWADTEPGGSRAQPRLAAIVKPTRGLALKALYGRGFRPPSVYEATYADYEGSVPNPSLRSEEIASRELSVIWSRDRRVTVQAAAFRSTLTRLIEGRVLLSPGEAEGGVMVPGGVPEDLVGQIQYQGNGEIRSKGVAAAVRVQARQLQMYANIAYASAERAEALARPLPASPRWLGSAGASWASRDWTVSAMGRYRGTESLHESRGGGSAGDFVEANLRGLYRTRLVYPVTLQLDVLNAFGSGGTVAASPVFSLPRLPIEGRRVLLGAEVRF